ncbi:ATP-grasp ribosomal peptide maturase [Streptomyces sp. NBC_01077]|uniref:ATP-grasp ribosomal peptide maturase n=1 Tax=Streptomyces sp. NBC_01077 TaxID=2903746 RepID=UPI0038707188|nr:ATP-grasp ribosomal peptide maturase [Streptomyces sp. NBC_01077]WSV43479.1 ATP-grasp ribosomal peptide maturase [Streptomyces sp. NBC_01077]
MSDTQAVVILTDPFDVTSDLVVRELDRRGARVFRCDTGDFPQELHLAVTLDNGWSGQLHDDARTLDLADVGCVYYRRPSQFILPEQMTSPERKFAAAEARMGFGGVISSLERWINHPSANAYATIKPVHLAVANACGLNVPPTLITNIPDKVKEFVGNFGKVVYKTLSTPAFSESSDVKMIYSSIVDPATIDDSVKLTSHLFQAWVEKDFEVRLTVVDDEFFAARIDAESCDAGIDWRSDYSNLKYSTAVVPDAVRNAVSGLLSRLNLRFAAIDFIVTADGDWVFLDLNPNGQWAWIEDETGLPIAAAIADALIRIR